MVLAMIPILIALPFLLLLLEQYSDSECYCLVFEAVSEFF